MSTTLVAVFDESKQAQEASRRLEDAGIDKQSIRIQAGNGEVPAEHAEDRRGFFAKLFGIGEDADDAPDHYVEAMRRGNSVLTVDVADEKRVDQASDILEECGAADVDERVAQWKTTGYAPALSSGRTTPEPAGDTLKSVEEELKVGKRTVQKGRVRVHRTTTERPVEEQVTLRDQKASVERTKVDRPATEADLQSAFADQDIEIIETSEEAVVSKSARVTEEVTVGKVATDRTEKVRDNVRSTRVDVENLADKVPAMARTYTGPERRVKPGRGSYTGLERRASL